MWGTRSRKIYRDITIRRARTLLVSLSVFVSVLAVVVLTTLGQIITRQLEKDLVPAEMAMIRLFVSPRNDETLDPQTDLATLRAYPGVTAVEGQAVYEFQWKRPDDENFHEGHLFSFSEPFGRIHLEPIRLRSGRYPLEGQNEIAIEQRMADQQRLGVGDTLVVNLNGSATAEMRIVGIVHQPYFYIGGGDGASSAYATYADAQQIVRFTGFSSIYARFKNFAAAREQSHNFRKTLMDQSPYTIVFYLMNDPQHNVFLVGVRQFSQVLTVLAIVAVAVASVLVTTVITTVLAEQRQQIGAMKALGASRFDLFAIYLGMAFVYGLIGTVPAMLIGMPLGQAAARAAAPLASILLEDTSMPLLPIVAGILLGLGVPVLTAIIPVGYGTRISIRDAMTDQGIGANYGHGVLPRLMTYLPEMPLGVAQALNNIFLHKARLALTLLSLTLSVAAFMGVFAVFRTLNSVVGDIENTLNYQVSTDLTDIEVFDVVQGLLMNVQEQIRDVQPGVAVRLSADLSEPPADELGADPGDDPNGADPDPDLVDLYVTGIDTSTDLLNREFEAGTGWLNDPNRHGIVLTPHLAEEMKKTVGDMVRLVGPERSADFEVIGVVEFPLETAFMEWQQLADFVGLIRTAPTPNAYWEELDVKWNDGDAPEEDTIWALGVSDQAGRLLSPRFNPETHGVIISEALAQAGGFAVGDEITLRPPDGSLINDLVEQVSEDYTIIEVVPIKTSELRVFARALPDDVRTADKPLLIAMYWADLADLVQLDYREITPETVYLDLANPEASTSRMNTRYSEPVPSYQDQVGFEDRIAQTILSLALAMSIAAILMAVVGGIGLLTITSIGVFERQREIGVMRSVGASSRAIIFQFLLEGVLVGLLAWGIGLPMSILFGRVLLDMVPFSDVIVLNYAYLAPLLGLLGMILVTVGATLYPALAAARKTVSDILRYQ